jgi:putative membrane protein
VIGVGNSLSTLPAFLAYFAGAGLMTAIFVLLYANLTPHREIALTRDGNTAAAVALVGGLLGFVVPLASVIAHSASGA